jgi:hypothetical protein
LAVSDVERVLSGLIRQPGVLRLPTIRWTASQPDPRAWDVLRQLDADRPNFRLAR